MRTKLRYALFLLIYAGCTLLASATDIEDTLKDDKEGVAHEVISVFYDSFGFDYLTKEECDLLNPDSLLSDLDASQHYYAYFDFERIVIKSYLSRGEVRMAIAMSDQMYSKARALSYPFGNALALNAMGEVYTYTGRLKEAGIAYGKALEILDGMAGEDLHVRMLLVELIDYSLRIRDLSAAAGYISRLNTYPDDRLSAQELAIRHISNASYLLVKGDVDAARQHLDKIELLRMRLMPGIREYLLIVNARYLVAAAEPEQALAAYDEFMETDYARINHNLYKDALQEKADLLLKIGRKEEAYKQYGKVFSYIK